MALVVDGKTFVQTGWRFLVLPNSQQQIALPFWELQSQPTPVSLTNVLCDENNGTYCLACEMSDGSTPLVLIHDEYGAMEDEGNFEVGIPSQCSDDDFSYGNPVAAQDIADAIEEHGSIVATPSFNTCSMVGSNLETKIVLTIDGVSLISTKEACAIDENHTWNTADFGLMQ